MKFKRKLVPHYNRKQINREKKTFIHIHTCTQIEKAPCIKININNGRNRHTKISTTAIIRNKFNKNKDFF